MSRTAAAVARWPMPLPDWITLHTYAAAYAGSEPPWPEAEAPSLGAEVVAEAEAYLRAHSALREQ